MDKFQAEYWGWKDMWELSREVAEEVRDSGFKPDLIIAVVRGGLVPAMNLSDILDIKDILCVRVEHWGKAALMDRKAKIKTPLHADLSGKQVLVVDDVVDSGESMELTLKHLESLKPREVRTATLIYKVQSTVKPDYYGSELREWRWIIPPWNLTEDLCTLIDLVASKPGGLTLVEARDKLREEFNLIIDDRQLRYALTKFLERGVRSSSY